LASAAHTPRQERSLSGSTDWRESVLDKTLAAAAIVIPPVVAVALLVRSAPNTWMDVLVIGSFGVLLPALRLAHRRSAARRALVAIAGGFATSIYIVARAGLGAGVSVALATMCTLAVVAVGRWLGYLLAGLSVLAAITVGLLVTHRAIPLATVELDPLRMTNWVRIGVTSALLSALLVTMLDLVIRHVEAGARATRAALEELRIAYEQLGLLHGRLEAAKEEERRFIAHELHDELGQTLTLLKLRLAPWARGMPGGAIDSGEAIGLVDQLIGRVRQLSGNLRPPLLDEVGLVPALRAYLERQAELSGVEVDLDVAEPASEERLVPDLEIACFRIVQESLTNALRHASPRRVHVRLTHDEAQIALSIQDDGAGFDTVSTLDATAARGHLGVAGMRERVRAGGGTFQIRSVPGTGTTVEAWLPTAPAAPAGD
jgi:signal transduction histidine kinase